MAKPILNNPSPNVLMNSMRSIGYSFKTAVADIVDNSISAKATEIHIFTPITPDDLSITFFDNGEGMTRDELFNAMKYGSDKEAYGASDLGRFGLGLKSASLSQCRKLTVVSKKNDHLSAFSWDLDCVEQNKTWECLELEATEIDKVPHIDLLKKSPQGTLVIWENFDILFRKADGKVFEALFEEVEEAEKHLSLVFHRFINKPFNPLNIYINEDRVLGCDPFLEDHPKTDSKNISEINYLGSKVKIQPFILPHTNDLTPADIKKMGGEDLLKNGQGFYIYRNNRLIIYGTWFRMAAANVSSELYKYGRIKVDIPNALDEEWDIDITKQNASIPKALLASLRKVVSDVRNRSSDKSKKRAKLTLEKNDNKIWNKGLNKEEKEVFYINGDSQFIKNFLDDFDDAEKSKVLRLLDIISSTVPYDDIYVSMCNHAVSKTADKESMDSLVLAGVNQFKLLKQRLCMSDEDTFEFLKKYEPFDDEALLKLVKERIYDGK